MEIPNDHSKNINTISSSLAFVRMNTELNGAFKAFCNNSSKLNLKNILEKTASSNNIFSLKNCNTKKQSEFDLNSTLSSFHKFENSDKIDNISMNPKRSQTKWIVSSKKALVPLMYIIN